MNPERCITEPNGFNSRLDEIQAAILNVKLKTFGDTQKQRHTLAQMYFNLLPVEVLHRNYNPGENYHLFTIRTESRVNLQRFLKYHNVDTMVHYPIPAADYWTIKYQGNDLPETYKFCKEVLSLPLYPGMTIEQVCRVCDLINEFYEET